MATPVIMPRQGQSVESCILTEWFKQVGDKVEKGEVLFAYETDKAAFEEVAPEDGVLLAQLFEEGDEVPVLSNVAVLGSEGEDVSSFASNNKEEEVEIGTNQESEDSPELQAESEVARVEKDEVIESIDFSTQDGRIKISPRARKLALQKRVDIKSIKGSGPEGRIIEIDVKQAIDEGKVLTPLAKKKMEEGNLSMPLKGNGPGSKIKSTDLLEASAQVKVPAASGMYTDVPLTGVRKLVSDAMYRSLQNSAQLTHHMSANALPMQQLRITVKKLIKEGYSHNITINDMVSYAVIQALKKHPEANAHFLGDKIRQFEGINLGIAVDTERGLLVPSLKETENLSLSQLSDKLSELAGEARKGSVSPDLLAPEAASFTISNLGNYGVEMFTPVINIPQVAILGVNTIIQRPAMHNGAMTFLPYIGLSLTYDHRALDGGPATVFLAEIKNQIENLNKDLLF